MRKNQQKNKSILFFIIFFILSIGLLFLDNWPKLQPLRDSMVYILLSKMVISGIVLFFTWIRKNKPCMFERVILTIFAFTPWIMFVTQSYRILLFIQSILFLILLSCLIKQFFTDKRYNGVTAVSTFFLGIYVLTSINDYTFLNNSGGIHFWQIGLVAAVILTTIFTVLLIKGKIELEDDRISEKIAFPLLILGLSFTLISFMICNFNYILDVSSPSEYHATIIDKRIDSGPKKLTEYIFIAEIKSEKREFHVQQSEYFKKESGDTFEILLYSGAFGDAYYIYSY